MKLYNELIGRMMKESEETEITEERIGILLFLWSVKKEESGKKETQSVFN